MVKNSLKDPVLQGDEEMVTNNFDSRLEEDFNIICNVIYLLPIEFDYITEVTGT